jgi:SAM-dependent methyltransferase
MLFVRLWARQRIYLVPLMKKTKPEFDRFAESYEKEINRALLPGTGRGEKYARIKASHLRQQLFLVFGSKARPKLLDAGCGIGLMDEFLKPFFPHLAGFDVSPQSVRLAQERNPEVQYKNSDGKKFPFAKETFDAVFAVCVLHHVPVEQRKLFVSEARRVLRPGGFFFLYEHNPWNLLTRFVVSRCAFDRDAKLLSSLESRRLLEQGGFVPTGGGSLILLPFESSAWQAWEETWLSLIPCGAQYFQRAKKPCRQKI